MNKLRNLPLVFMIFACQPSISDRFALEYMAQKFHDENGLLRHSCDMQPKGIVSECYGFLDRGLVIKYHCSLDSTECKSGDP